MGDVQVKLRRTTDVNFLSANLNKMA